MNTPFGDPSKGKGHKWTTMHSSADQSWMTPPDLIKTVQERWGPIGWDAFASKGSCVLGDARYFGPDHVIEHRRDALTEPWRLSQDEAFWANPEYGRKIHTFTERVLWAAEQRQATVYLLVFARTDTKWFQALARSPALSDLVFIKGRITFLDAATGKPRLDKKSGRPTPAPAGSALMRFRPGLHRPQIHWGL